MAKGCDVCGGLIMASNEVMGYGGPICQGNHATGGVMRATTVRITDPAKASPMTTSKEELRDDQTQSCPKCGSQKWHIHKDNK